MSKTPAIVTAGVLGGLLFGYTIGIVGTAQNLIQKEFSLSDTITGLIGTSFLVGALIGSLAGGLIQNRLGRRPTLLIGAVVATFSIPAQVFAPEQWTLFFVRIVVGGSIGLLTVVCPTVISEGVPPTRRGVFGVLFQLAITFGIVVANITGYIILNAALAPFYQWRLMFAAGVLFPLILLLVGTVFLTESEQWLRQQSSLEPRSTSIDEELLLAQTAQVPKGWPGLFSFHKGEANFIMAIMLGAALQMTGINAVMFYGPNILKEAGFDNEFLLNIVIGSWNFVTTIGAVFLIERLGRRPLMLGGIAALTVALLDIALSYAFLPESYRAYGVGVGLALFILGFEFGPGALFWVLVNECFPAETKDAGSTLANVTQWAFNLLVVFTFPLLLKGPGPAVTFGIFAGCGVLCTIYLAFALKETRARAPERVNM